MQAELLTTDATLFQGEITELQATTSEGAVTILPHHENFIAIILPGTMRLHAKGGAKEFDVGNGVLEVRDNTLRLIATSANPQEVETALQAGIKRAQDLDQTIRDKQELHRAEVVVDRSSTSLGVATMKRRRRT